METTGSCEITCDTSFEPFVLKIKGLSKGARCWGANPLKDTEAKDVMTCQLMSSIFYILNLHLSGQKQDSALVQPVVQIMVQYVGFRGIY